MTAYAIASPRNIFSCQEGDAFTFCHQFAIPFTPDCNPASIVAATASIMCSRFISNQTPCANPRSLFLSLFLSLSLSLSLSFFFFSFSFVLSLRVFPRTLLGGILPCRLRPVSYPGSTALPPRSRYFYSSLGHVNITCGNEFHPYHSN